MPRISAFIAVLALIGTTAGVSTAQAQSTSAQKGCYNSQTCAGTAIGQAIDGARDTANGQRPQSQLANSKKARGRSGLVAVMNDPSPCPRRHVAL
jgi:hypothetical protein